MIDKHPGLIARSVVWLTSWPPSTTLATRARRSRSEVAATNVTEGGVMIDLSLMRGIHVDPAGRTARAQGGVTWGELNRETQVHGLAVTGGPISTTGIAGLTLGGGWAG
jgi:FAD/FMN-containing dehydrogenase